MLSVAAPAGEKNMVLGGTHLGGSPTVGRDREDPAAIGLVDDLVLPSGVTFPTGEPPEAICLALEESPPGSAQRLEVRELSIAASEVASLDRSSQERL